MPGRRTCRDGSVVLGWAMLLLLLAGCAARADQPYRYTRFAMDTVVDYVVLAPDEPTARRAVEAAHAELERVARKFWEEDSTSQVFRFNEAAHAVRTDEETYRFVTRAQGFHEATGGAFDLGIRPVLSLYGFERGDTIPPSEALLASRLPLVGIGQVSAAMEGDTAFVLSKAREGVALAVGGMAKGYAVDRAVAVLREAGIEQALVNAGGDLYALGARQGAAWRVGVQHPRSADDFVSVLALEDRAVATSGDYQRFYFHQGRRYHHLLDPETGRPAAGTQSATVIAPTVEEADVYATAVFVLGPEAGIRLAEATPGIYASVVDSSGLVYYSEGFEAFMAE